MSACGTARVAPRPRWRAEDHRRTCPPLKHTDGTGALRDRYTNNTTSVPIVLLPRVQTGVCPAMVVVPDPGRETLWDTVFGIFLEKT